MFNFPFNPDINIYNIPINKPMMPPSRIIQNNININYYGGVRSMYDDDEYTPIDVRLTPAPYENNNENKSNHGCGSCCYCKKKKNHNYCSKCGSKLK